MGPRSFSSSCLERARLPGFDAFGRRLRHVGPDGSMGSSRSDGRANALAESPFATLECELFARQRFPSGNAARPALSDDNEAIRNSRRPGVGWVAWISPFVIDAG